MRLQSAWWLGNQGGGLGWLWYAPVKFLLGHSKDQSEIKLRTLLMCPLSQWCYLTLSSSATFSFCPKSFPASECLPISWFFTSGSQSIGASASASIFPVNIQAWFPLRITGLIFLLFKELLRVFYHCLKASVLWCSAFFMVQLSHL